MVEEIEELAVDAQFQAFAQRGTIWSDKDRSTRNRAAQGVASQIAELAVLRVSPPVQAPVLGSTAETNASGFSHWIVPGCVTPGMGL
jgi:hypothetical protein